jgi:hypothetical protein
MSEEPIVEMLLDITNAESRELLRRAAKLLRYFADAYDRPTSEVDEWLKDAGMDKSHV